MDYSILLILNLNGLLMLWTEWDKVSSKTIGQQLGFMFIVNLPLILYFNLIYLNDQGIFK